MEKGKRIILLGDGMPDEPLEELEGKTPLQVAQTPNMDRMAREGGVGGVQTVPEGYPPGSDVTNMGLLGYDPQKYYTGRAPLEAASMGVPLGPDDVAYRCNLVTLLAGAEGVFMDDFSAGHIGSAEAARLIAALNDFFADHEEGRDIKFYPGVSYRHVMVWKNGKDDIDTTPPHDIIAKNIKEYLPQGDGGERLRLFTGEAQIVLKRHEVNVQREKQKLPPANSIWLWGQGKAPSLPKLDTYRGLRGAMISAVDLMNGLGVLAGMEVIHVEGATGYIDTNYKGKADAAIAALKERDFVYLHVEAPDEAGHAGSLENKIKAIEDFDEKIVGPVLEEIDRLNGRAMVLSDHRTPLAIRTHSSDPVPFAVWPKMGDLTGYPTFDESILDADVRSYPRGYLLFEDFIR